MSYTFAIFWYSLWIITIVGSYFASRYAILYFEKKWKADTEEEEQASEKERA